MNLFEKKTFTMHSGDVGHWKIECDALTEADIETLAFMISERFEFAAVHGIPTGAIRIEKALEKYLIPKSNNLLIVDDVLTTGASMEAAKKVRVFCAPLIPSKNYNIIGVVLFARTRPADWIYPMFQLWSK